MCRIVLACLFIAVLCTTDAFARGRRLAAPSTACSDGVCSAPATIEGTVTVEVGPPSIAPAPPAPSVAPTVCGSPSTPTKAASKDVHRRAPVVGLCAKAVKAVKVVKPVLRCAKKVVALPFKVVARRR